jgi:hypothetical protein
MNVQSKPIHRLPREGRIRAPDSDSFLSFERLESSEARFSPLLAGCEDLVARYGREALQAFTEVLHTSLASGRVPSSEELLGAVEGFPDRLAFAAQILNRLERSGKIARDDSGMLFQPEKILSFKKRSFVENVPLEHHPLAQDRVNMMLIAFAHERVQVVNEEGEKEAVPVFYQPQTKEEAFSVEGIKQAKFYFAPFQIDAWFDGKTDKDASPTSRDRISLLESSIALALYHPRFGGGERLPDGTLVVKYADGHRGPITGKWFKEFPGLHPKLATAEGKTLTLFDQTSVSLRAFFPELVSRGLLTPEDFKEKNSVEAKNRTRETLTCTPKGVLTFEGIRYTLGTSFASKTLRIQKITPEQAMLFVVSEAGQETPSGFFRLFQRTSPEVVVRSNGKTSATYEVPLATSSVRPYDSEGRGLLNEPGASPTLEHAFARAKRMVSLEERIRNETSTSLRMLPRAQYDRVIFSDVVDKHRHQVELAVREVGSPAVEMVGLLAEDTVLLPEVVKSLTLLPEEHRTRFAEAVGDAVSEYTLSFDELRRAKDAQDIDEDRFRDLRFELQSRLLSLLTVLRGVRHDEKGGVRAEQLLQTFQTQNVAYQQFGVLFREACKGRSGAQLAHLEGITVERRDISVEALSLLDQEEMRRIFVENWKTQDPIARATAEEAFERALRASSGVRWMFLKKDGRLAAFLRAEELPNNAGYYLGSLNVLPELQSSAVGEQVLAYALGEFGETHEVQAHFVPTLLAGASYIERQGFFITGTKELSQGKNTSRVIAITRPSTRERERMEFVSENPQTFSFPHEEERMLSYIEHMTAQGFVGTRFYAPSGDPLRRTLVFSRVTPQR